MVGWKTGGAGSGESRKRTVCTRVAEVHDATGPDCVDKQQKSAAEKWQRAGLLKRELGKVTLVQKTRLLLIRLMHG